MIRNKTLTLITALILINPYATNAATKTNPTKMVVYCPPPTDLEKDPAKLTWSAERNTFRSYDISFSDKIDKFVGAQWVGANVGQITCIYKALPKTSFPVLLIFHTLTLTPSGSAWSEDLGGYKNCNSLNRKDCPFIVRLRKKETNIYEEAGSLKSNTSEPPTE